jgi:hypothetical protein
VESSEGGSEVSDDWCGIEREGSWSAGVFSRVLLVGI